MSLERVRRYIRAHPVIYPMFVRFLRRNHSAVFPGKGIQLHLTGFQRSANTFCYNIIHSSFPDLKISTHIHTIASLKLALQWCTPTIVLIREPFGACASWVVKQFERSTKRIVSRGLDDYVEYYSFVNAHKDTFKIVSFDDVISTPDYIVRVVDELLGFDLAEETILEIAGKGNKVAQEKEKAKNPRGSSLPRPERVAKKEMLRKVFEADPRLEAARNVYKQVLELN